MSVVGKEIGDIVAPVIGKLAREAKDIVKELSVKQDNVELQKQLADKMAEIELAGIDADARVHEANARTYSDYTKVLIADAQGKDKAQRQWRPHLAYGFGGIMITVLFFQMILFPILGVAAEPESWQLLMVLLPSLLALLGVKVAGRTKEKTTLTEALAGKFTQELPRDKKADRKLIKAMRRAGMTPEQILEAMEQD